MAKSLGGWQNRQFGLSRVSRGRRTMRQTYANYVYVHCNMIREFTLERRRASRVGERSSNVRAVRIKQITATVHATDELQLCQGCAPA